MLLAQRVLLFVGHFINGSLVPLLFVFTFFGLSGLLFIPNFQIDCLMLYYLFVQILYLCSCLISINFEFLLLLMESARQPTPEEELELTDALLSAYMFNSSECPIAISVIEDDLNSNVFVLSNTVCFTTAALINNTRKELIKMVIQKVKPLFGYDSNFLTILYFVNIPKVLVIRLLNFLVFNFSKNQFFYLTIGVFFEFFKRCFIWMQKIMCRCCFSLIQEPIGEGVLGVTVIGNDNERKKTRVYQQDWFENYSLWVRRISDPEKTS